MRLVPLALVSSMVLFPSVFFFYLLAFAVPSPTTFDKYIYALS